MGGELVRLRKRRARFHLMDEPGVALPSVEGIYLGYDWRLREYRLARGELLFAAGARPDVLENDEIRIARERVAFYEVLR